MGYFLKLVGMAHDPLPENWWIDRPEIADGIFFGREPTRIRIGDILIYYAVGGLKCVCGVANVLSMPTRQFTPPASWNDERRTKFRWKSSVALLHKCRADRSAPKLSKFHPTPIGQAGLQRLDDGEAEAMIAAIVRLSTP